MNIEVDLYEAKIKLPELLRGVQACNRYTITLQGAAIADLIPSVAAAKSDVVAAVAQMCQFIESHPPILGVDTKALLEERRD